VYATGPKSQDLEELQFTLGEGPGVDALEAGGPVLAPDDRRHLTVRTARGRTRVMRATP
jgi:hypothetical protein